MVQRQVTLANAQIGFKNFQGLAGKFNKAGDRSFAVFMDEALAKELEAEGWNVKWPKERDESKFDEEDTRHAHLPVAITFDNFPPKVILIAGEQKTMLSAETVDMLDWAEIENVDLIVRPYNWEVNGEKGVKAYVKAMYVTIVTDAFTSKYGM